MKRQFSKEESQKAYKYFFLMTNNCSHQGNANESYSEMLFHSHQNSYNGETCAKKLWCEDGERGRLVH